MTPLFFPSQALDNLEEMFPSGHWSGEPRKPRGREKVRKRFQRWEKRKISRVGRFLKRLVARRVFIIFGTSVIPTNNTRQHNILQKCILKGISLSNQIKSNFGLCDQRLSISNPLKARPYSIDRIPDSNSIM